MKNYETNIFDVLSALDRKDLKFFDILDEKQLKDISPYMLMKWLSGTNDLAQIYILNETINNYAFSLQKHKELLIDILSICTSGKTKRYKWNKTKKSEKFESTLSVIKDYFGYSSKEAKDALNLLDDKAILAYSEMLGRQEEDLVKIKKELKQRS